MKKDKGITLIELLVVIAVASILAVALGFGFAGWQGRYKVESQTKDLYDDLMNARMRAMQRNRVHFVSLLDSTSYTIYEDTDEDQATPPPSAGDTELPSFPKTVEFDMKWDNADIATQEDLVFNTRGLATNLGTISVFVDRDGDSSQDFEPDYGCIIILATRINIGKWDGANCDAK